MRCGEHKTSRPIIIEMGLTGLKCFKLGRKMCIKVLMTLKQLSKEGLETK